MNDAAAEQVHAARTALGVPLIQGRLAFTAADGAAREVEVAVWGAPAQPVEGASTWRGWLFIHDHPTTILRDAFSADPGFRWCF